MFSYSTVVYGLKQSHRIQEAPEVLALLSCRNNIIYEHHSENDESCGWPGLHYHGLFEYITKIGFQEDRIIKQIKMHCSYFAPKDCESPLEYFILVNRCKMTQVFTKMCTPTDLFKHIQLSEALQQENTLQTIQIVDENIPQPCYFKMLRNDKYHLPILDLCKEFYVGSSLANDYLTPADSAAFVDQWCFAQGISTKDFVNDLIYCLNSESQFRNTLYFQGVNLCIKAILRSVEEACEPHVGKVSKGTTGYKYFWKHCLGKRMIALYEPYFDGLNASDTMLNILEGTKSRIIVDNNVYVTMRRTPIIVVAQEWPSSRKLQFEMKNRLVKWYGPLKTFNRPEKKIHPAWLCILAKIHYIPWCQRNDDGSHATPNKEFNKQNDTKCVTQKPETQPAILAREADILPKEHCCISNLCSPESQKEECENTSDQNPSELSEDSSGSEFMDTEDESENASIKSDFIGPKLVIDAPQIYSKSTGCENVNEDIPGLKNDLQDTRENDVRHQSEENLFRPKLSDLPSQGIDSPASSNIKVNKKESAMKGLLQHELADLSQEINSPDPSNNKDHKKKATKKSRQQVKTDGNTSAVEGLFQPVLGGLPSSGINTPGPSTDKINEKIRTKKNDVGHQSKEENLFRPEHDDLPSQGIDSPASSNIKVNKKKETKKSEVRLQCEEESTIKGRFQHEPSQEINSPGPSNNKDHKKKATKKSGQVKTDNNTSAVAGLFQPVRDGLPSPGINTPGPSTVKIYETKQTKSIQGLKKRPAEENFTGKEKLRRNWENGQMIHPVKIVPVTFKHLMKNQK